MLGCRTEQLIAIASKDYEDGGTIHSPASPWKSFAP